MTALAYDPSVIHFPDTVTPEQQLQVLDPLNHSAWRLRSDDGARYRRAKCQNSPLRFAITYLDRYLRQPSTGVMSLSRMHVDMAVSALSWIQPGEQRDAWIGPRNSGKSLWAFHALPLWALAFGHRKFLLAFAYTDQQARGHLVNLLDDLRSNDLLLQDFPGLKPRRGQASAGRTVLESGVTLAVRGMGGTSLGARSGADRPDLLVGDDLEPGEVDNSPQEVEKNRSRLLRNVLPMNTEAAVQVAGTVTMHGSLVHDFVHAAKGRPEGDWVRRQRFTPHYYPALDETGRSLWPQRWTAEWLRQEREADPAGYALNYDNDPPRPQDEELWSPGMFQYDENFPIADRVLHLDVAVTTNATSDFTCLVMLGRDAGRQRALVERVEWGRWTAPEIRQRIHTFCGGVRVKPLVRVESNQGGSTWLDSLAPWPQGVRFETCRASAPKKTRIRWAHSHYYRRAVWHPWPLEEFEQELCRYPRGEHDDVADAVAGALTWAFPIDGSRR